MVFALPQEKHQKIHRSHSVSVPPPGHPSCIVSVESASARWEQHAAAGDAQLWWFSGGTSHFQPRGFLGAQILEGTHPFLWGYSCWHTVILCGWWFQPLWKIWKSVGVTLSNIWKVKKIMFQTTNQLCHIGIFFELWKWLCLKIMGQPESR